MCYGAIQGFGRDLVRGASTVSADSPWGRAFDKIWAAFRQSQEPPKRAGSCPACGHALLRSYFIDGSDREGWWVKVARPGDSLYVSDGQTFPTYEEAHRWAASQ